MGKLDEENKFEIAFYVNEKDDNIYYEIRFFTSYTNPLYTDEEVLDKCNKYSSKFETYIKEALNIFLLENSDIFIITRKSFKGNRERRLSSLKRKDISNVEGNDQYILEILKISSVWNDEVIRDIIHNCINNLQEDQT